MDGELNPCQILAFALAIILIFELIAIFPFILVAVVILLATWVVWRVGEGE